MNYRNILMVFVAALLLAAGTMTSASADDEPANTAEEAKLQAQLEAEYEKAMLAAEKERLVAEASIEKAREKLQLAAEQKRDAVEQSSLERAAQQAEMEKMHEELNHARRQLQQTSREISRVNREVSRARSNRHASGYAYSISDRPVIGVILGDADDVGVKVLGVSPDGPAERAGIKQGDTIVALGGRVLAAIEESADAKEGLQITMRDIKAEEPVNITVERGQETLDLTVTPQVREPLTWQTITRFSTAPTAPPSPSAPNVPGSPLAEHVITVERIEVPEIDSVQMTEQIEQMRAEIDERRALMEAGRIAPRDGEYEIEFHDMSEMGNFALHDANVWFGLPMAQGLQLAEIDPDLGEYFKTDRGVLVLKAKEDNDLQLKSGDVILQVGDTEVNSPAEFMRALRGFESGDELEMNVKRKRKDHTLKMVMPESRTSFFAPLDRETHTYTISTTTH